MTMPDIFLFCFAVGVVWSVAALVIGGLHFGHSHQGHLGQAHHGHSSHVHPHAIQNQAAWWGALVHPSSLAAFFTWFGGVGYVLTRHTGWRFWADLAVALAAGAVGAWILGSFLRFVQSRDEPLSAADYQMIGVLGRVSSVIRSNGVGEVIYLRDGARKPVAARSEGGDAIACGEEVIITRYDHGIAHVRTWAAMVPQSPLAGPAEEALQKDVRNVE